MRSYSSASSTRCWPLPALALVPSSGTMPPTMMVGSRLAFSRTRAIMAVVVVLPWVPATAMLYRFLISQASICPLFSTGVCLFLASTTSGLFAGTAEETTTRDAPPRFSSACPAYTVAPSFTNSRVMGERRRSDPETLYPLCKSMRAIALRPMPPMPTKCTRSRGVNVQSGFSLPCLAPAVIISEPSSRS